jgi:hypothetical protein
LQVNTTSGPASQAKRGTLLSTSSQFGEASSVKDQSFWFWDSVFSDTTSDFCRKKHGEAMAMPQARGVRDAEIDEYLSHVRNATFGPALAPHQLAPGPALKAVWVFSRSKEDPGAFKARVVMQSFLMKQGLHFNDIHAPVPAVTTFRVFMVWHPKGGSWSIGM